MVEFHDVWPHDEFDGNYGAWLKTLTSRQFVEYIVELEKGNYIMAATRRGRPAKATASQTMLEALAFIEPGTVNKDNQPWKEMLRLSGNMAVSFNGQVAAGHPIAEELTLCPQMDKLKAALKRCGKSLVISETPTGQISVKGDKLRALVPCMRSGELPVPIPDIQCVTLDDKLKEAFKVCGKLATEAGEKVHEASILLEANQCTGTNGAAILQYWHGIDLPPHMVLPKVFTEAVANTDKPLTGFGFSWGTDGRVGTVTFYFEGGAWLKTQCYLDRWPDVDSVLNVNVFPTDTPAGLFDAIEAVAEFSEDEHIVFAENQVMSHTDTGAGAQWEIQGLQGGKKFKGKLIKLVAPHVGKIDLTTYNDRAYFFGPENSNIRGAIIGFTTNITYRDAAPAADENLDQSPEGDGKAEGDQSQGWGTAA